jgi:hypothetical protein
LRVSAGAGETIENGRGEVQIRNAILTPNKFVRCNVILGGARRIAEFLLQPGQPSPMRELRLGLNEQGADLDGVATRFDPFPADYNSDEGRVLTWKIRRDINALCLLRDRAGTSAWRLRQFCLIMLSHGAPSSV